MSDIKSKDTITYCEKTYLPEELKTSPEFNVRPFQGDSSEHETQLLEELAACMEQEGQLEPVLITTEGVVLVGHRRRSACLLINERLTVRGESLFRLKAAIVQGGDLHRKSLISNIVRKNLSPMDMALNIKRIRQRNGWQTKTDTRKVAQYLSISVPSVIDYEKFLNVERDLQNKLHSGVISVQSALRLLKELPEPASRAKALERAAEIQKEDQLDKTLENCQNGKLSEARAAKLITQPPKSRIESPAIIKAIRETHTTKVVRHKAMALSRAELIESIRQFDNPEYPEPIRLFARFWATKFVTGQGDPGELRKRLLAIIPTRKPVLSETLAV
jgi:ParB-like chromosome segregation protein Spo0J